LSALTFNNILFIFRNNFLNYDYYFYKKSIIEALPESSNF